MALRSILILSTGMATVLAAAPADSPAYVQVARELGSFGLVAFIVYWIFTRTLPKMTADHKEAVAMIVKDAKETRDLFECHIATMAKFMGQVKVKPKDDDSKV